MTDTFLSPTPRLQAVGTASGLVLRWSGPGVLQWSPAPDGPFSDIPGSLQSYTNTGFAEPMKFFRIQR